MGRYSPTVTPYSGPDFSTELARALSYMRQRRLDEERREERDWQRGYLEEQRGVEAEERERARELEDLALAERGYDRFEEPPTVSRAAEAPPLFGGAKLGMADRPEGSPLAMALGALRGGRRPENGRPLALPGQFVPELGDFTPGAIFEAGGSPVGAVPAEVREIQTPDFNPDAYRSRPLMRPTMVEAPDPRYEHVTGSLYRDLEDNPEARARASEEEEFNALAQALGALRGGDDTRGTALARLMAIDDVPAAVMEHYLVPEEEEEEGFTADELLAAGVDEEDIAAALRDPILARQLVLTANRPEPRAPAGPYGYGRSREQWLADLEAEQGIRARYRPSAGASGSKDAGDPAYEERRDALIERLGEPETEARQIALDQLASGMTPEEILAEMERYRVPEEVVVDVRRYIQGYKTSPFRTGG